MNDEMWRSAVESFMPVGAENGSEVRYEGMIFANKESVFRFLDNGVTDIGRIKYYSKVYGKGLKFLTPGFTTRVCAAFDELNQEYFLHLKNLDPEVNVDNLFVFSQRNNRWIGTFDYKFDFFTSNGVQTLGLKAMDTYEIGVGNQINGANIQYSLLACASPEQFMDKEFMRIRINTKDDIQKPTRVEFFAEEDGVLYGFLDATQGALFLKNYRGWEQYIPRILASVNPARPRFQQRIIFFNIKYSDGGDFKVIDTGIQYKVLKGQ
jgi:hypothetical protein